MGGVVDLYRCGSSGPWYVVGTGDELENEERPVKGMMKVCAREVSRTRDIDGQYDGANVDVGEQERKIPKNQSCCSHL